MLHPQKKIPKREIKEDTLVTKYFEARTWIEEHRRLAGYIVAAPIVLVALWFWWSQKTAEWNETATTQLAKVQPYYDQANYDAAIKGVVQEGTQGLQAIVDEYGNTRTGELARFYLANSYFAIRDFDKALACYKDVSVSDKMVSASALAGIAACHEAKGNHDEAGGYFEKAASKDMSGIQAPENLRNAAANFAAAGKNEKAVELLKTLKKEFPNSQAARDIDRYIAQYSSGLS